jgi:hypothetical protein
MGYTACRARPDRWGRDGMRAGVRRDSRRSRISWPAGVGDVWQPVAAAATPRRTDPGDACRTRRGERGDRRRARRGQRRRPHPRHWPPLRTRWDSRTTSEQDFWRRQAGHPSHGLNARRNSCRVANGRLTRIRRPHWRRPRHQPPGCGCPCGASRGRSIPSQHYAVYIMWSITNVSSARHRARRCWSASRCGTRVSPGCRQGGRRGASKRTTSRSVLIALQQLR